MWRPTKVVSERKMSWVFFFSHQYTTAITRQKDVTFPRWALHSCHRAINGKDSADV